MSGSVFQDHTDTMRICVVSGLAHYWDGLTREISPYMFKKPMFCYLIEKSCPEHAGTIH